MSESNTWRVGPVLGVRNVQAATDYYTGTLGFECPGGVFQGAGEGEGGVYAVVRRGGIEIHLQIRRREVFAGERAGIESDAYIFVEDADALCREFEAKGVVVQRALADAPYGLRDFVIEDLDGHRLAFGSPLE